jgi:hypothetical protein
MRLKLDYKNEELGDLRAQLRGEARVQAGNSAAWIEDILKQWEDVRRDNDARRLECDRLREQIAVAEDRYRAMHRQLEVTVRTLFSPIFPHFHFTSFRRMIDRSKT